MKTKDFSILLEPVSTTNTKKDLAFVDGTNSIVQQIENLLRTNKGENSSNPAFGANLTDYLYDIGVNRLAVTNSLKAIIKSSIRNIFDVSVGIDYYSENLIIFNINFSTELTLNSKNTSSCKIEIPLL